MKVRPAGLEDCEAIGGIHVEAWQAAYRGLMPDDYLNGLDPGTRAERWRSALATGTGQGRCQLEHHDALLLVVEDDAGSIVGISVVGPDRGGDDLSTGELWMINLVPEAWGRGIGSVLLAAATDELRRAGYRDAVLWVLVDNARARRFYEREGWLPTARQRAARYGASEWRRRATASRFDGPQGRR